MIRYLINILLIVSFYLSFFVTINIYAQDNSPHGKDFNIECEKCHNTDTWEVNLSKITFDHNETGFPLTGQHSIQICSDCHKSLKFNDVSSNCFSCHVDAHKNSLGLECIRCHNTNSWKQVDMQLIHNQFRFPLTGVHKTDDCQLCHTNSKNFIFTGASINCIYCHQKDFVSAVNPMHAVMGLSKNCEECHTTRSINWSAERFKHLPLSFAGAHVNLNCNQCHNADHLGYSQDCYTCHKNDFEKTTDPPHAVENYPHECAACHNTTTWAGAQFNHDQTGFSLTGSHKNAGCQSCHQNGYAGTPTQCFNCHENAFNTAPKHTAQGYPHNCEMCHSTTTWNQTSFNHNATAFQLTGSHINVDCSSCHTSGFTGTPTQCYECHQTVFNSAPNHVSQGYPHNCEMCHATTTWNQTSFNHNTTAFVLTGSHINVNCSSCHVNGFAGTPQDCFSCHEAKFNSAPEHVQKGYPHTCETCHNTTTWDQTSFDHNTTSFPLTGSHITVVCSSCHTSGYSGTPKDCYSCHQSNYNTAEKHTALNYPHACITCHNTTAWNQINFNHNTTNFQLTGRHINTNCNSCHTTTLAGTPKDCFGCHQSEYNQAENHVLKGYPHTCETCHNTTSWDEGSFDHNTTGFVLAGGHQNVQCSSCHEKGYAGTSSACISCHDSKYKAAPQHLALGYPQTCEMCHNTTLWSQSSFNHSTTNFQLTGSHINTNCNLCHTTTLAGTPKECFSCHESAFNSAPDHSQKGYPHTCADCHNTSVWNQVTFDHSNTAFALTGAHINVNCSDCHSSGFAGTPKLCQNCHTNDYNNAGNPSHKNLNLPFGCEQCHTTNPGWTPAQFPTHSNYFTFVGAHVKIKDDCNSCHNGNYNNTPNTCFGCHQADYNGTTNPAHASIGFPQTCVDCHSQTAWTPSTFDHDNRFFPIYSGTHNRRWDKCSDCHTTATNYKVFSCIDCHEHNKTETDGKHREVSGYSYNSSECYRCHPRGSSEGGLIRSIKRTRINAD